MVNVIYEVVMNMISTEHYICYAIFVTPLKLFLVFIFMFPFDLYESFRLIEKP